MENMRLPPGLTDGADSAYPSQVIFSRTGDCPELVTQAGGWFAGFSFFRRPNSGNRK